VKRRVVAAVLVAAAAVGGCFFGPLDQSIDGTACVDDPTMRFAADPATGQCFEFGTSCDVPPEWPPCGGVAPGNCAADSQCPDGMGCVNGTCGGRNAPCVLDSDCPLSQHCAALGPDAGPADADAGPMMPGVPGQCMDNAGCMRPTDCPMDQWCDFNANGTGLCSSGAGPALPGCTTDAECAAGMICPAQYGGCSAGGMLPPDGSNCPSYCEPTCLSDMDCAALNLVCNAAQVCAQTDPSMPTPCTGWCVAPPPMP
jgi:hypothetical protein